MEVKSIKKVSNIARGLKLSEKMSVVGSSISNFGSHSRFIRGKEESSELYFGIKLCDENKTNTGVREAFCLSHPAFYYIKGVWGGGRHEL